MSLYDLMEENVFIGVGTILIGVCLVMALVALPCIQFSAIGEKAEIESLRTTVTELGIDARSEDILGKVADINMKLESLKSYNKIPILEWWIADSIAELDLIEIPKG